MRTKRSCRRAAYNTYAGKRGTLAWQPAQRTPLSVGGIQLPTAELGPLATLYEAQRCAIVANVGPLIQPINRTTFLNGSVPRPAKLFSHNDQQSTWQASAPEGATYGWGGRIGDLLAAQNGNSTFTTINLTGNAVFLSGSRFSPIRPILLRAQLRSTSSWRNAVRSTAEPARETPD